MAGLRVAIIGDYTPEFHSHPATTESIHRAALALDEGVTVEWIPTASISRETATQVLGGYDAIWASPGSPYKSFAGMLTAIEFARTRNRPFIGT
ncbi:MAG: hypothetical protein L0Z53_13765 [Acidobacteriales bacterium]|nr:hypothetical protein [Terriglobales bacterium]